MAAKDLARSKAFERWVGAKLGGRRRRSGEGVDEWDDVVDLSGAKFPISVECKAYEKLQLRMDWVDQARRNAGNRPWVIIQRPRGSRTVYATMDFELLLALYGMAES